MPAKRQEPQSKWECFCRQGIQEAVVRLLSREGTSALTMERVVAEAGARQGDALRLLQGQKSNFWNRSRKPA